MNAQTAQQIANARRTCKAYDPTRRLDDETFGALLEALRLAPSSINIQPWQFLVADTDTTKARLCTSMTGADTHNVAKVMNASHVIVLCTRTTLDNAHLDAVMAAEKSAGRFKDDAALTTRKQHCLSYLTPLQQDSARLNVWAEQQTFIALGHLLMAAQIAGVQATPIGGFNNAALDDELSLHAQGLKSSVIVSLGYASADDANQTLPKARLPAEKVITFL
ncbi:NAD(P)H nitroreductase [Moraxella caviae]|uniref:NAD(P)H nitroreductase n=1 Tax=Moraxella caviae TaxID=34060 RepID=A0A1T0A900_9GAMM|nr:oxygen-insensitive NAD(P)H nitroreductase [Moraxella caviae]OOR92108.1 NAD(P)H nitroreductase [Moraxella caviae]STZ14466.1 Oxygen-insensitive NAD(P)H nitroreductase [Moraxella caviae]